MDLKESELLGTDQASHWYYRAKLSALRQATSELGATSLLDVGSGSGFFARELLKTGSMTQGVCVDPGYSEDSCEMVAGKPLLFRRSVEAADCDLVLMMDVLEHVADDAALLREYADRVASGTRFFVTVPAFQWLWSGHDVFLEHYRRYTLAQLERTLDAGGLMVERSSYFYGALFPVAAAMRLASRVAGRGGAPRSQMKKVAPLLNEALYQACRLELPLFPHNRLAGLSVTALAVKP